MARRVGVILRNRRLYRQQRAQSNGVCFYCGRYIYKWQQVDGHRMPEDSITIDHVYPETGRRYYPDDAAWLAANRVECCQECNLTKGRLDPLDWLVIMPSNEGAERLATLLLGHLWVPDEDVKSAMRRRK